MGFEFATLYRTSTRFGPRPGVAGFRRRARLDDIRAARAAVWPRVVLGRALLEGRFTLAQALAC